MRILVVDDEIVSRMKLQKIMGGLGECKALESAGTALVQFQRAVDEGRPYDLVCLDIAMPGMNGIECLKRIRAIEKKRSTANDRRIKIVMITSHRDKETIVQSAKGGCDGYITKPFQKEVMVKKLAKLGFEFLRKKAVGYQHDTAVVDFLTKQMGQIIVVSHDAVFYKTLKAVIHKTLAVTRNCAHQFMEIRPAMKLLKEKAKTKTPLVVFLERVMDGSLTTDTILELQSLSPSMKLIVLTEETSEENLIYLHDLGASSIITKPASANNLIEKMANAIRPMGKIAELVIKAREALVRGDEAYVFKAADAILEQKPDSATALMLKGDAHLLAGRREEAIAAFEAAHECATLYLDPLKRLADIYAETEPEMHLHYLKLLDQISPMNTERKTTIGTVHAAGGDLHEAERYFDKAMKCAAKESKNYVAQVAHKVALAVQDADPTLSEKYLSQALNAKAGSLSRDDMAIFNRLGIVLRRQGRWQEAISNYARALQVAPDDEGLYYNMAMACADGGRYDDAARHLERVFRLNADFGASSATVCCNVANVYRGNKMVAEARCHAQRALQADPAHKGALALIKALK